MKNARCYARNTPPHARTSVSLSRQQRYWRARHYTVVERGPGWLLAISRRGRIVVRTAPSRRTRQAAALALLELADAVTAAAAIEAEGAVLDQGAVYLDEQPGLDDLVDDLDLAELDALEHALDRIDLEDSPF
jgi:uncharacterized protein (DUF1778 family)